MCKYLILITLIVSAPASSSLDFAQEKVEAYDTLHASYKNCRKSVSNYKYWNLVTACMEKKENKHCINHITHQLDYGKITYDVGDFDHCEALKPTEQQFTQYLDELMAKKKSQKPKAD